MAMNGTWTARPPWKSKTSARPKWRCPRTRRRSSPKMPTAICFDNSPSNIQPTNTMKRTLKSIAPLAVCLVLALGFTAGAEEKKIDPTGTWKSSYTNQDGQVRESTIKLKAEGDQLTGTVSGRNNDATIEQCTIKGDEISFQVTREFGGNKVVIKYSGKVSGDTIKGKSESQRDGQPQTRDWVAKKEAAAK